MPKPLKAKPLTLVLDIALVVISCVVGLATCLTASLAPMTCQNQWLVCTHPDELKFIALAVGMPSLLFLGALMHIRGLRKDTQLTKLGKQAD